MTFDQLKQSIVDVLKKHAVRKAAIFGSYARGEANEQSDVDLLIETGTPATLFQILELEEEIFITTSKKADIVEYGALKSSIRTSVLSEAIQIL